MLSEAYPANPRTGLEKNQSRVQLHAPMLQSKSPCQFPRTPLHHPIRDDADKAIHAALGDWWRRIVPRIEALPEKMNLFALRRELLDDIDDWLLPQGILTLQQVRGAFANYMDTDGHTIKVVGRYQQYRAVQNIIERLRLGQTPRERSGVVWHTQGSGKSLTMVWLSKWIKTNMPDSRVLIITDREELDGQIEKLFKCVGELNIVRTQSGKDLVTRLNQREDVLMCSLIHKFGKHV